MKEHIPYNKTSRVIGRKDISENSSQIGNLRLGRSVPITQCKYKWSKEGDDGVLIGDKYVIKLEGYTKGTVMYESYAKKLQLSTPNLKIITPNDKLWKEVLKAIKNVKYMYKNGNAINDVSQALIMDRISGIPYYANAPIDQVDSKIIKSIFFDIGKIITLDLFLRNYDRFDLSDYADCLGKSEQDDKGDDSWNIWKENLGNLYYDEENQKIIPIDSNSYLFDDIAVNEYWANVFDILQKLDDAILRKMVLSSSLFASLPEENKNIAVLSVKRGIDYAKKYLFEIRKPPYDISKRTSERRKRKPKKYYARKHQKINRQKELDKK